MTRQFSSSFSPDSPDTATPSTETTGPDGRRLTRADLPDPGTRRWITRRKAAVVAGVEGGLISLDEACRRYALSIDEFLSWRQRLDAYGLPGLRATRLKRPGAAADRQKLPTR